MFARSEDANFINSLEDSTS
jgi:hypothetical protein